MTTESTEQELVNRQGERNDRAVLPSAVNPEEVLDTVQYRVSIPLAEGNLPQALRAVVSIWEELHEYVGPRDLFEDPVSSWVDDDKACGVLCEAGIITMLDFMERRPVDFLSIPQIGETLVRKFAQVQSRFRCALEEQEALSESALPGYQGSATMSE